MRLDQKKQLKKRHQVESKEPQPLKDSGGPPKLDRDKMEALNLQKFKKSLRELIDERDGKKGGKLKMFAL